MAFPTQPHAKVAQTGDAMFTGYLDPEMAQDYFAEVEKTSIIQQVARKVPLGPTGIHIPHWTGDVAAEWVGESAEKPITKGDMGMQTIRPHKIATIFVASAEVVRANPGNYLGTMRTKVAEAIALAFDKAVLAGTDTPFGAYIDQTTKEIGLSGNTYDGFNGALGLLVGDGKKMSGVLLDDVAEPIINSAKDGADRPLFIDAPTEYTVTNSTFRRGAILGRPTILSDHVATGSTLGYAGDWSQVIWGQIGGLSYDVSDETTLNMGTPTAPELISLWQHNLVAVRVEAEFGVLVNDPESFVRLTNAPVTGDAGDGQG